MIPIKESPVLRFVLLAEGPNADRALAALLIAAVGMLLLLGIKLRRDHHPTNRTAAGIS
jgi:hypothetical protein